MEKPLTTPQELARILRDRAVMSMPISELAATRRYANWLDDYPVASLTQQPSPASTNPCETAQTLRR